MTTGRKHLTRHEMKQDDFVSGLTRVTQWVEENARIVLGGIGAIVLLVLLGVAWATWSASRAEEGFTALSRVQKVARTPVAGEPGAAADALPGPRDRAQRVVEAADRVLRDYGGEAADWARYYRATALLELDRKDEAATEAKAVMDAAGSGSLLEGLSRLLAGRVEEARGNPGGAAEHYAAAASLNSGNFPPELALYDQARCLRAAGKTSEATTAAQKILDLYPDSPMAGKAGELLQELRSTPQGL